MNRTRCSAPERCCSCESIPKRRSEFWCNVSCPPMGCSAVPECIVGQDAYLHNRCSDRDCAALHCVKLIGEASRLLHLQSALGLYQGRRRSKIGSGRRRLSYRLPGTCSWALRPDRGGLLLATRTPHTRH